MSVSATEIATPALYSYPIGLPGHPLGDGFFIRDGYTVENTWYNPGSWHTGEDWYALNNAETAGARVYAVADGQVVYAEGNYPGRVVIIQHAAALFSMYGHLDNALAVQVGQTVKRGALIGTVGRRNDNVPNHLHFEIRTFLTTAAVNGNAPRYPFKCGAGCPPGPGYWPFNAPDLPSQVGWRNPTHVIAHRAFPPTLPIPIGEVVVATQPVSDSLPLWSSLSSAGKPSQPLDDLALKPGDRFALLEVRAGPEDSRTPTAQGYRLWYRIALPDEQSGWVQAAVPSTFEHGTDGRPSSVMFNFFPAVVPLS